MFLKYYLCLISLDLIFREEYVKISRESYLFKKKVIYSFLSQILFSIILVFSSSLNLSVLCYTYFAPLYILLSFLTSLIRKKSCWVTSTERTYNHFYIVQCFYVTLFCVTRKKCCFSKNKKISDFFSITTKTMHIP